MPPEVVMPLTRRGIPIDPQLRILALGSFANRFGAGAVMTTSAIYFTRQVGFTTMEVGFALGVAALIGLVVSVPAGHLGDTRGPREILIFSMTGAACCAALPAFARTPWMLALFLGLYALFERSANSVYQGIIAQIAGRGRTVTFKAYLRAVTNTAIGLGSMLGGLALVVDEVWAYLSVFFVDAVFTAVAAFNSRRLPHVAPSPVVKGQPRLAVARDLPFVTIVLVKSIFTLHFIAMEVGLALYISTRTIAPNVMVAIILALNTAMVALFQVRLSRRSDTVLTGARSLSRAALWIGVGFAVLAMTDRAETIWVAIILLIVGALIHVVGEMIGSGGEWGILMGLAPMERQGQYQGFAGLGYSLLAVVGPPLVTYLCVEVGEVGWLVLGLLVAGSALALQPLSRWALATRDRYGVTTHTG